MLCFKRLKCETTKLSTDNHKIHRFIGSHPHLLCIYGKHQIINLFHICRKTRKTNRYKCDEQGKVFFSLAVFRTDSRNLTQTLRRLYSREPLWKLFTQICVDSHYLEQISVKLLKDSTNLTLIKPKPLTKPNPHTYLYKFCTNLHDFVHTHILAFKLRPILHRLAQ